MKRRFIGASEGSSVFLVGVCLSGILVSIASLFFKNGDGQFGGMPNSSWVGYALTQASFIAAAFGYFGIRKLDIPYLMRIKKPRSIWQLLFAPLIAIATILVFLPLANAWSAFLNVINFKVSSPAMPADGNVGVYFLSLFVLCLLPAIGEESLLRGGAFRGLSSRGIWFGILMSALFFSLMHANPVQTVHQFGLGVVIAIAFALTDSIFMCALIHFFNNFISVTLNTFMPFVDEWYIKLGYFNWLTGFASVAVGLFLLVLLLYCVYKLGHKGGLHVYSDSIEYDDFRIYAIDDQRKTNPVKDFFRFFGSLFTKSGWKKLTGTLASCNVVEYRGKVQPMIGVWIALALVAVYWLVSFIMGLI